MLKTPTNVAAGFSLRFSSLELMAQAKACGYKETLAPKPSKQLILYV
jgi:hypothetical protein